MQSIEIHVTKLGFKTQRIPVGEKRKYFNKEDKN
jgi:hypothetical protein